MIQKGDTLKKRDRNLVIIMGILINILVLPVSIYTGFKFDNVYLSILFTIESIYLLTGFIYIFYDIIQKRNFMMLNENSTILVNIKVLRLMGMFFGLISAILYISILVSKRPVTVNLSIYSAFVAVSLSNYLTGVYIGTGEHSIIVGSRIIPYWNITDVQIKEDKNKEHIEIILNNKEKIRLNLEKHIMVALLENIRVCMPI